MGLGNFYSDIYKLYDITHGQRENSGVFHTKKDDGKYYYLPNEEQLQKVIETAYEIGSLRNIKGTGEVLHLTTASD